jgi:hypothetical protein
MFNFRSIPEGSIRVGPPEHPGKKTLTPDQKMLERIEEKVDQFIANPEKNNALKPTELTEFIDGLRKSEADDKPKNNFEVKPGISQAQIKREVFKQKVFNQYFEQDFVKPNSGARRHKDHEALFAQYLKPNKTLEMLKNSFDASETTAILQAVAKNIEQRDANINKIKTTLRAAGKEIEAQKIVVTQKDSFKTDMQNLAELRKRNDTAVNRAAIYLESKMIEGAQQYMPRAEVESFLSSEQKVSHADLLAKYQEPRTIAEKPGEPEGAIVIKAEPRTQTDKPVSKVEFKLTEKELEQIQQDLEEAIAVKQAVTEMEEAPPEQPLSEETKVDPEPVKIKFEGVFEKLSPASLKILEEIVTPPNSKESSKIEKNSSKNQTPLFNAQIQTQFLKAAVSTLKNLSVPVAKKSTIPSAEKAIKKYKESRQERIRLEKIDREINPETYEHTTKECSRCHLERKWKEFPPCENQCLECKSDQNKTRRLKDPALATWTAAKHRARSMGIEFSITIEDVRAV